MPEETLYEEQAPRKRRRIATFFRRLASRFDRGETVTLGDAQGVAVTVPAEPDLEVELERENETIALEQRRNPLEGLSVFAHEPK